ncbi:MAG TPA: hypothetical protein VN761_06180 [Candidatus Polarisedimenticolia bacterium]|nr:hypothetical protein [Candidatus Polarisedimenticolia bacterium]
MHLYWTAFTTLIRTPFEITPLIWGIVPLYFALFLSEMTSTKANFRTAIQTGFSFIWASLQWLYPYFRPHATGVSRLELGAMLPVNLFVTFAVLALGIVAFLSGVRRKYPKYFSFLGYTRFANYFMITIFPMQARVLNWEWDYVIAIILFAIPVWLVLNFGLMPIRGRK